MPWLLATLTVASALAGPAYADSFGGAEAQEAEAMLAAEVPEVPMEAPPPDVPEPVLEAAAEPPSEPAPAAVEAPDPEPLAPPAANDAMTLGVSDLAEPAQPADPDPAEEVATEPPAYIAEVPIPTMPDEGHAEAVDEEDTERVAPPVVVPVNLNVDLRILSPGNDGDVNQIIDLGGLGLGSGDPSDALGALGDLDLGLDWTWNWNWKWDCGDASVAGLDWNWTWTWSGDCATGILDEIGDGAGSLGDHFRGDHYSGLLDELTGDGLRGTAGIGDGSGPLVSTPGAGGSGPTRSHGRDEAESAPAPASPFSDAGPWVPSDALTSFASTGATSQSKTAAAPSRRPAGADPNGDPERQPAGPPVQPLALAAASGGGGGGGAVSVLLLAALVGALALVPPPPGGRVTIVRKKLSSLLSSSRLERPG